MVHANQKYSQLNVSFEKVFSSPATSAPAERVFLAAVDCLCGVTARE
jgi:hypothetical protein